jgi:hypothetical protein
MPNYDDFEFVPATETLPEFSDEELEVIDVYSGEYV